MEELSPIQKVRLQELREKIAYSTARADIECNCTRRGRKPGPEPFRDSWWDTNPATCDEASLSYLQDALEYLGLLGKIVKHPTREHWVQIKEF